MVFWLIVFNSLGFFIWIHIHFMIFISRLISNIENSLYPEELPIKLITLIIINFTFLSKDSELFLLYSFAHFEVAYNSKPITNSWCCYLCCLFSFSFFIVVTRIALQYFIHTSRGYSSPPTKNYGFPTDVSYYYIPDDKCPTKTIYVSRHFKQFALISSFITCYIPYRIIMIATVNWQAFVITS